MKRAVAALFGLAVACSPPPLPAASYEPPNSSQAMKAFRLALAADGGATAAQVREMRESDFTALGYQSGYANNNRRVESDHAMTMVSALQNLQIDACTWQKVGYKGLPGVAKARLGKEPPLAGYFCTFEARYQINPPYGKRLSTNSDGYFMKMDEGFVFAGKYDDPY
jgi:hypothetical protein